MHQGGEEKASGEGKFKFGADQEQVRIVVRGGQAYPVVVIIHRKVKHRPYAVVDITVKVKNISIEKTPADPLSLKKKVLRVLEP